MTEHTVATLYRWDDLPRETLNSHIDRRLITGTNMMIAHVYLKKGGVVPVHSHHNEQLSYVLEGALRFLLGAQQDEEVIVRAGEVLTVPPHLPHSAEALEDTLDVDIFNPPRQDWLDGSDQYLRG
jgi:quercetin dioxygenase-like cupin family protein